MKIRIKSNKSRKNFPPLIFIHLFISKPLWRTPYINNLIDLLCKYKEWIPEQWELCFDKKKISFSEESKADVVKAFQPYLDWTLTRTKEGTFKEEIMTFNNVEFIRKSSPKYSLRINQWSGPKRLVFPRFLGHSVELGCHCFQLK